MCASPTPNSVTVNPRKKRCPVILNEHDQGLRSSNSAPRSSTRAPSASTNDRPPRQSRRAVRSSVARRSRFRSRPSTDRPLRVTKPFAGVTSNRSSVPDVTKQATLGDCPDVTVGSLRVPGGWTRRDIVLGWSTSMPALGHDGRFSAQQVAEADGNRTRQGRDAPLNGFEDAYTGSVWFLWILVPSGHSRSELPCMPPDRIILWHRPTASGAGR